MGEKHQGGCVWAKALAIAVLGAFIIGLPLQVADGLMTPVSQSGSEFGVLSKQSSDTTPSTIPTGQWTSRTPMPTGRFELAVTNLENKIYAVGGIISGGDATEVYDPSTNVWTVKTPLPYELRAPMAASVDGKLYVIGGKIYPSGTDTTTTLMYDPSTDNWTMKSPMKHPRNFGIAAVIEGKIYVIGGLNDYVYTSYNEMYDPKTDTWTDKAPIPLGRGCMASAVATDEVKKIFVMGGWHDAGGGQITNRMDAYNPLTNIWEPYPAMPWEVSHHSAAASGDGIYVMGGANPDRNSVCIFDLKSSSWTIGPSMPTARNSFGATVVNGKIYTIGGNTGSTTNDEFDPYPADLTPLEISPVKVYTGANVTIATKIGNIGFSNAVASYLNVTFIAEGKGLGKKTITGINIPLNDSIDVAAPYKWKAPNTAGIYKISVSFTVQRYPGFSYDKMIEDSYINNAQVFDLTVEIDPFIDSDGDGMLDLWEDENGLDPQNPDDALSDIDYPSGDGLTNYQEYLNGTDPNDGDTDNDQLGDGFELVFSKTNPKLWDTDGDGLGDGLEFLQDGGYSGSMETIQPGWIGMRITWENYTIFIATNSSVLRGSFDSDKMKLKITVSGKSGTKGSIKIIGPRALIRGFDDLDLRIDNKTLNYTLTFNSTHTYIFVNYTHSTHEFSTQFVARAPPGMIGGNAGWWTAERIMAVGIGVGAGVGVALAIFFRRRNRDSVR